MAHRGETRNESELYRHAWMLRPVQAMDMLEILDGWNDAVLYDRKNEPWFRATVCPTPGEGMAWVAIADDHIVGFAAVSQGNLRGLFGREDARGCGIGSALLRVVVDHARSANWPRLRLVTHNYWCWIPGLDTRYEAVIRFFKRHGFVDTGMITDVAFEFGTFPLAERHRLARNRAATAHVAIRDYTPALLPQMKTFLEVTVKLQEKGATSMFASYVPHAFYEANGWRVCREYASLEKPLP